MKDFRKRFTISNTIHTEKNAPTATVLNVFFESFDKVDFMNNIEIPWVRKNARFSDKQKTSSLDNSASVLSVHGLQFLYKSSTYEKSK